MTGGFRSTSNTSLVRNVGPRDMGRHPRSTALRVRRCHEPRNSRSAFPRLPHGAAVNAPLLLQRPESFALTGQLTINSAPWSRAELGGVWTNIPYGHGHIFLAYDDGLRALNPSGDIRCRFGILTYRAQPLDGACSRWTTGALLGKMGAGPLRAECKGPKRRVSRCKKGSLPCPISFAGVPTA